MMTLLLGCGAAPETLPVGEGIVVMDDGTSFELDAMMRNDPCATTHCQGQRATSNTFVTCLQNCISQSPNVAWLTNEPETAKNLAQICSILNDHPGGTGTGLRGGPDWFASSKCWTLGSPTLNYDGSTVKADVTVRKAAAQSGLVGMTVTGPGKDAQHFDFKLEKVESGSGEQTVHFEAPVGAGFTHYSVTVYADNGSTQLPCKSQKCESWNQPCPRHGCEAYGYVMASDHIHHSQTGALPTAP